MTSRAAKRVLTVILCGLLAISAGAVAKVERQPADQWNFTVYLDGDEIGYHHFQLSSQDGVQRLSTEARFSVRFLFFTAYSYEHRNEETWQGDCLQEIRSETRDNGRAFTVQGSSVPGGFEVEAGDRRSALTGCVKTFAYWNPDILEEPRLMNAQTGEVLPVTIEPVAEETLIVSGEETPADRYRLLARNMELDIWYSKDSKRWLALESTVKGGRKLRYQLT